MREGDPLAPGAPAPDALTPDGPSPDASVPSTPVPAAPVREDWQRFHPLTPLLRGGIILVAVVAGALGNQADQIFGGGDVVPDGRVIWIALSALAAVAVVAFAFGWLTWRVSRFRLGETTLELHTGLLFRQHRQVRHDRIQAVDVRRPLLARLLGLSELKVQAAGGNESDVTLAFLTAARAREVREVLLRLAGQSDEVSTSAYPPVEGEAGEVPAPVPGADTLLRIPNVRLMQSVLWSGTTVFLIACIPVVLIGLTFDARWVIATIGPVLLGVVPRHLGRLLREANFEVSSRGGTLWLRQGLTETRTSSIPLHRVQALSLKQPLFWRPVGWWRVEANVAGVQGDGDDSGDVVLSVGTLPEVLVALQAVRPMLPAQAVVDAVALDGPRPGWVVAAPSARWVSPLVRSRQGYAVTDDALLLRHGRWGREVQVVPHARLQSVTVEQGPVDRRLGLATVSLVSTPGSVSPGVAHLATADAEALATAQSARAREARRSA